MSANRALDEVARLEGLSSALGRKQPDVAGLAKQIHEGLHHPIDFPGLGEFLFSGDRIVIAVHSDLAQIELVLNPILHEFSVSGNETGQVTVLFADKVSADRFRTHAASHARSVPIAVHEGTADGALALLGADDDNQPILVNRLIFDADVMIPLVRASQGTGANQRPMMWDFFDSATKQRWRRRSLRSDDGYGARLCEMAGVIVAIQVVIGPGDFAYDVVVGRTDATKDVLSQRLTEAWRILLPTLSDIVVATIDDHRDQRSWQAVRDSIVAAAQLNESCSIAVFSHVDEPPPNELRGVFSNQIAGTRVSNFDPALRSAIANRNIYLCSALNAGIVHDLGLKSITGPEEARKLLGRFEHPVLLRDAQRANFMEAVATLPAQSTQKRPKSTSRKAPTKRKPRRQK